jgi:hypothetical protein
MRPSVQKSLLLAVGLAFCASFLDGWEADGSVEDPALARLRAIAASRAPGAHLVLLPDSSVAPAASPVVGGASVAPSAPAAVAEAPPADPAARRDRFLRRAYQLVATAPLAAGTATR